jgi:hypothetical protein
MPKTFADKLDCKALTVKYQAKDLTPFKVLEVREVNFKPHPFCIGTAHVAYAADHCGGMLGREVMEKIPCKMGEGHGKVCNLPADQHSFDVVLLLQLIRNSTNDECSKVLKPLAPEMEADGIDGLTLVETPEKFRVSK